MTDGDGKERALRRWFKDPGHTAVVLSIAVMALLLGGGTAVSIRTISEDNSPPRPKTVTETVTETVEVEAPVTPTPTSATVGLEELLENEDVESEYSNAEFENRNIGGKTYGNAVTGEVYPDGSGVPDVTIFAKGRFTSMHFIVGIDSDARCPQAHATVSIEDESGTPLWGPKNVDISHPASQTIAIPKPLQVVLLQRSAETESGCDAGVAEVSWGDVYFGA